MSRHNAVRASATDYIQAKQPGWEMVAAVLDALNNTEQGAQLLEQLDLDRPFPAAREAAPLDLAYARTYAERWLAWLEAADVSTDHGLESLRGARVLRALIDATQDSPKGDA